MNIEQAKTSEHVCWGNTTVALMLQIHGSKGMGVAVVANKGEVSSEHVTSFNS